MGWEAEVVVVVVVVVLVELVLHWFPWRLVHGRGLHQVLAYVLGVLGFAVPVGALLTHWQRSWDVGAGVALGRVMWMEFWVVVGAGVAVAGAYMVDGLMVRLRQRVELQELLDERPVD